MSREELVAQLKEFRIYDNLVSEYRESHIGNIPKKLFSKEFKSSRVQELLTKYNIEYEAVRDIIGI